MSQTTNNNGDEDQFPSLVQQGKNLLGLAKDIGSDAISGASVFVNDFEEQRRYDICQGCDSFDRMRKRCRECGCFMKKKVVFSAAKCPLGKW